VNTPRIRVENRQGVWWLISPEGDPFVSLGVNHLQPDCWLAPYNREHMLRTYGGDLEGTPGRFHPDGQALPRLVDRLIPRLRGMGFNTLGIHTVDVPARLFADHLYYCVAVEFHPLGSRFRFGEDVFPDIFSDAFTAALEEHIRSLTRLHRDNPSLIGYVFSDIPRWYFYEGQRLDRQAVHPWVEDLARMPPGSTGASRLRAVLGKPRAETRDESNAVLRVMVDQWYRLHATLLRKHDPGRLLLGDKLHSPHRIPRAFEPILREHLDILCVQWYTPPEEQAEVLRGLHERTGLPILNGDSSFCCPQPPHQTEVKGFALPSRTAAGEAYHHYLTRVMAWPFMLGWHHCGILEQWDGGKSHDWERNENGFLTPFEAPIPEYVTPMTLANQQAHSLHSQAVSGPEPTR